MGAVQRDSPKMTVQPIASVCEAVASLTVFNIRGIPWGTRAGIYYVCASWTLGEGLRSNYLTYLTLPLDNHVNLIVTPSHFWKADDVR